MKISDKLKYVYVTVPKAGSTSMFEILNKYYEVSRAYAHHETIIPADAKDYFSFTIVRDPYTRAVSIWYHMTQRTGDRYGFIDKCPCSNMDDPVTFLNWFYKGKKQYTLKYYKERIPATRLQSEQLKDVRLDKIIKLENLEEEFKLLPFYNGNPEVWPKINVGNTVPDKIYGVEIKKFADGSGRIATSNKRVEEVLNKQFELIEDLHWGDAKVTMESYLTPELKETVRDIFKQDFDTFDYRV